MKIPVLFIVCLALLCVPAASRAGDLCFQDNFNNTYRLSIKPACKATSAKPAQVLGVLTLDGDPCNGSQVVGIHGVCFGAPSEGKVHMSLVSAQADGVHSSCGLQSWNLLGESLTLLSGGREREGDAFTTFETTTFTAIACP
ncbi:MAG: hypothetical protein HYZ50_18230 [Deltaproteobacteria bacterium]|nr:hypothetical protein [Deltaproteobacteria bacterium]